MSEKKTIPNNWCITTIGDVYNVVGGGTPSTAIQSYWNGTIPWITSADINGVKNVDITRFVSEDGIANSTTNKVPARTLLVVTRVGLGKIAIAERDMCFSQDLQGLVLPSDLVCPEYTLYYLSYELQKLKFEGRGTTISGITKKQLKDVALPLPPTNEQKRIVAKVDELFSELDIGIENLKLARRQLRIYRRAILKHAFEGKLTADWRKKNKGKLEPAAQLLARVSTQRKKKLEDVSGAECSKFSKLPTNWRYVRLGCFIESISAGKSFKCDEREPSQDEIGVAKVSAVTWGEYDEHASKTCSDPGKINPNYFIQSGDFLFSRANTIDLVGSCVIAKTVTKQVMLSDKTLRIQFADLNPYYFLYYLRSQMGRNEIMERSTGNQESMRNIGQNRIKNIIIPICSPLEAEQIVIALEQQFSIIDDLEQTIDVELKKSEYLRQSILKKAFSGGLVVQDLTDESASLILERIKDSKKKKAQKKTKRKTPATIIQFPNSITSISTTDLHAGIIGLAYNQHQSNAQHLNTLGHVKAEKIAHLIEYHLGIGLGRNPVKDAAGPNDYQHLKKVEHRANKANWFSVQQRSGGEGYSFSKKRGFEALLNKTTAALNDKLETVQSLIALLVPLNTQQAEIVATLHAAWNNLLIAGNASPTDEEIVTEARENWHESKLNIERERFFKGLVWLRKQQLIPQGMGAVINKRVGAL